MGELTKEDVIVLNFSTTVLSTINLNKYKIKCAFYTPRLA